MCRDSERHGSTLLDEFREDAVLSGQPGPVLEGLFTDAPYPRREVREPPQMLVELGERQSVLRVVEVKFAYLSAAQQLH